MTETLVTDQTLAARARGRAFVQIGVDGQLAYELWPQVERAVLNERDYHPILARYAAACQRIAENYRRMQEGER